MKVSQGIEQFFEYQRLNVKKNTIHPPGGILQLHQELGRSWLSKPLRQSCATKTLQGRETGPIQDPGEGCGR
jgi:hypothetical protein